MTDIIILLHLPQLPSTTAPHPLIPRIPPILDPRTWSSHLWSIIIVIIIIKIIVVVVIKLISPQPPYQISIPTISSTAITIKELLQQLLLLLRLSCRTIIYLLLLLPHRRRISFHSSSTRSGFQLLSVRCLCRGRRVKWGANSLN